ncbi:MAG: flagellar hook-length control protein FliK [Thiotrichaceae bacterium]|nr:flagellar hook-length control protein FliK [Thiotrichaceae bacterium]
MVDKNCPMDLLKTSSSNIETANVKIDSLQIRSTDLLSKLQQAGQFRAIVLESNGGRLLLDTAFGQLKGIAADKLITGDEIVARILPGKTNPGIKIEQVLSARQAIPQKMLTQLIKVITANSNTGNSTATVTLSQTHGSSVSAPALPQVIKVLSHSSDSTLLQVGQKTYTLPRQSILQPGDTLLMRQTSGHKIEVIKIHPESILKNALVNLLPRLANGQNGKELINLQKLAADFLQQKPTQNNQPSTPQVNKLNLQTTSNSAENKTTHKATVNNQDSLLQASSIKTIKQLLQTLSQPLMRAGNIKVESLQQVLGMLTLVKPTATTSTVTSSLSIPHNVAALHQAIKNSPENFNILLRQIIESNSIETKIRIPDSMLNDLSGPLKVELLQQLEQTLHQLLTQKTTVRLNQEQNQPIQINLNIPVQADDGNKSLKLSIKQRKSMDNDEQNHWEINLAFEFAQLGLISTNLLLQNTKLSAHFWSVKSSTKQLIDTHMDQFKNQLQKSGFELGLFDSFIGKPVTADKSPHSVFENLVDIQV